MTPEAHTLELQRIDIARLRGDVAHLLSVVRELGERLAALERQKEQPS